MIKLIVSIFLIGLCFFCIQCNNRTTTSKVIEQWTGRQILFPDSLFFFQSDGELIDYVIPTSKYKIILYVDSISCASCELRLSDWKNFNSEIRGYRTDVIPILFFLNSNNAGNLDQLHLYFEEEEFPFPYSIDSLNLMNQSNNFPVQQHLNTFLLDENDKVVLIGNPVLNSKIRKLYEEILFGKQRNEHSLKLTNVIVDKIMGDFGSFDWQQAQTKMFSLQNVGNQPLAVQDVTTSCGCTSVGYAKEPVLSGKSLDLKVTYKAEHPEHFNKTVTVYCNASASPLQLKITGNAREIK